MQEAHNISMGECKRQAACQCGYARGRQHTNDLKGADDIGVMQEADHIQAPLAFHFKVSSSAWPHALVSQKRAFAQQLDCIQVHVCTVQHQLHLAEGSLTQRAHYDILIHKSDALQCVITHDSIYGSYHQVYR